MVVMEVRPSDAGSEFPGIMEVAERPDPAGPTVAINPGILSMPFAPLESLHRHLQERHPDLAC